MPKPKIPGRKQKYVLTGGPYDGHALYMTSCGTLEFQAGKHKGYYNRDNRWVNTNPALERMWFHVDVGYNDGLHFTLLCETEEQGKELVRQDVKHYIGYASLIKRTEEVLFATNIDRKLV